MKASFVEMITKQNVRMLLKEMTVIQRTTAPSTGPHHAETAKSTAFTWRKYRKTSNISRTLVANTIVDNSDVVGSSPVGAAPTTSSFST